MQWYVECYNCNGEKVMWMVMTKIISNNKLFWRQTESSYMDWRSLGAYWRRESMTWIVTWNVSWGLIPNDISREVKRSTTRICGWKEVYIINVQYNFCSFKQINYGHGWPLMHMFWPVHCVKLCIHCLMYFFCIYGICLFYLFLFVKKIIMSICLQTKTCMSYVIDFCYGTEYNVCTKSIYE